MCRRRAETLPNMKRELGSEYGFKSESHAFREDCARDRPPAPAGHSHAAESKGGAPGHKSVARP